MKNPFIKNYASLRLYAIVWGGIAITQTGILHFYYQLSFFSAISDGLVYNTIYASMSLNFWYALRYLSIEKQKPLVLAIAHSISALIFLSLWLITGNFILNIINEGDVVYQNFALHSFIARSVCGLLYYFIVILIYYLYIYYFSFRDKLTREADLRTIVKETELSLLRSQLNPHFIFNSLNSISSLTLSNPTKAQDMLIKLSSYLRYALENNREGLISLSEELNNSMLYLEIEKVRFGDKLIIEKEITVKGNEALIPNMILQPLLENAIKHGVYESTEPVIIHINCKKVNQTLHIIISNNFDENQSRSKKIGIGLRNVQERLKLTYGENDLLKTRSKNQIFEVEILIPQNI